MGGSQCHWQISHLSSVASDCSISLALSSFLSPEIILLTQEDTWRDLPALQSFCLWRKGRAFWFSPGAKEKVLSLAATCYSCSRVSFLNASQFACLLKVNSVFPIFQCLFYISGFCFPSEPRLVPHTVMLLTHQPNGHCALTSTVCPRGWTSNGYSQEILLMTSILRFSISAAPWTARLSSHVLYHFTVHQCTRHMLSSASDSGLHLMAIGVDCCEESES